MKALFLRLTAYSTNHLINGLVDEQLPGILHPVSSGRESGTNQGRGYSITWELRDSPAPATTDPVATLRAFRREYPTLSVGILRDVFLAGARCATNGRGLSAAMEIAVNDDLMLRSD